MQTIDGKNYSIVTSSFNQTFVPAVTNLVIPVIWFKGTGQNIYNFINPELNNLPLVVDTNKAVIPLYFTLNVFVNIPNVESIFSYCTPYVVNIDSVAMSSNIIPTSKNFSYASKISPYTFIDQYILKSPTGNGQQKQFIGQIGINNWQTIQFDSSDFVYPNPAPFVTTDSPRWYLNYFNFNPIAGVPPSIYSSGSSKYVTTIGSTYFVRGSLMYLELN